MLWFLKCPAKNMLSFFYCLASLLLNTVMQCLAFLEMIALGTGTLVKCHWSKLVHVPYITSHCLQHTFGWIVFSFSFVAVLSNLACWCLLTIFLWPSWCKQTAMEVQCSPFGSPVSCWVMQTFHILHPDGRISSICTRAIRKLTCLQNEPRETKMPKICTYFPW
jgi:hypothetical protein